jgi:hypothetical protein
MAAQEKKQGRRVRFELSWGGIAGILALSVAILLWMFVLGMWTGQSLLQSSFSPKKSVVAASAALIVPLLQKKPEQ